MLRRLTDADTGVTVAVNPDKVLVVKPDDSALAEHATRLDVLDRAPVFVREDFNRVLEILNAETPDQVAMHCHRPPTMKSEIMENLELILADTMVEYGVLERSEWGWRLTPDTVNELCSRFLGSPLVNQVLGFRVLDTASARDKLVRFVVGESCGDVMKGGQDVDK